MLPSSWCFFSPFLEWCAPWNPLNPSVLFLNLTTTFSFHYLKDAWDVGIHYWDFFLGVFLLQVSCFPQGSPAESHLSPGCLSTLLTFHLFPVMKRFLALPVWSGSLPTVLASPPIFLPATFLQELSWRENLVEKIIFVIWKMTHSIWAIKFSRFF